MSAELRKYLAWPYNIIIIMYTMHAFCKLNLFLRQFQECALNKVYVLLLHIRTMCIVLLNAFQSEAKAADNSMIVCTGLHKDIH